MRLLLFCLRGQCQFSSVNFTLCTRLETLIGALIWIRLKSIVIVAPNSNYMTACVPYHSYYIILDVWYGSSGVHCTRLRTNLVDLLNWYRVCVSIFKKRPQNRNIFLGIVAFHLTISLVKFSLHCNSQFDWIMCNCVCIIV